MSGFRTSTKDVDDPPNTLGVETGCTVIGPPGARDDFKNPGGATPETFARLPRTGAAHKTPENRRAREARSR